MASAAYGKSRRHRKNKRLRRERGRFRHHLICPDLPKVLGSCFIRHGGACAESMQNRARESGPCEADQFPKPLSRRLSATTLPISSPYSFVPLQRRPALARHLANDSMRQVKPFCSAYATSAALLSNFLECIDGCFVMPTSLNWYVWAVTLSLWDEGGITRKFY